MLKNSFFLLTLSVFIFSCNHQEQPVNKFSDPTIRLIGRLRDERMADSLLQFLFHENAAVRKEAAMAFASIQDSSSITYLSKAVMREKDNDVRRCLAFAIGQTPSADSERIILGAIIKEKDSVVLSEMLEAYGKTTSHWQIIKPAFFHDTITAEGLAWSIYRAGINGKTDTTANSIAGALTAKIYNEHTRLGAVHYFSRAARDFDKHFSTLKHLALTDPSAPIRMAATSALRKIKSDESLTAIQEILKSEKDYRVRVNAARALAAFDFEQTKGTLFSLACDKQIPVAVAASEVIRNNATPETWFEVSNLTAKATHWQVLANAQEGALKAGQTQEVAEEIYASFANTRSPYEKAAWLTALKNYLPAFDFLETQLLTTDVAVVRSAAASALSGSNYLKDFDRAHKERFLTNLSKMIELGDAPSVGTMAAVIADSTLHYKEIIQDTGFLVKAKNKMKWPEDQEAIDAVNNAITYLTGKKQKRENKFNHPIDWDHVAKIPADQQIIIRTSRGHIKLKLFVEDAPGSVSNFLKLASANYYDHKSFHRVVPNFVIQGGCKRGDGSGSENYTIRSEFSHRNYDTGALGMASAGKDTEGTQWFITHSPTPHLDGRYTIFGEVTEGMDVVEKIEVGDEIISIKIL
jgi:cyclophilin family peptidyl-prolyl cis-trans isomerase/HEAT repeat protein